MTWISSLDGPTKGRHEEVPKDLLEEAEKAAKAELEGEVEEEKSGEGERMEE
jgi:20S proteasome subunit alpha 7